MTTIFTIIHVSVCFFLIVIVLLQHGKGADMGATFGGASQTVFGTEGPTSLLNKITTFSAIVFMVTSVALAYLSSHAGKGSVIEGIAPPAPPPIESPVESAPPLLPGTREATPPPVAAAPAETTQAPAPEPAKQEPQKEIPPVAPGN